MDGLGAAQFMQWLGTVKGEATAGLCVALFLGIIGGFLAHKITYKDERYSKK